VKALFEKWKPSIELVVWDEHAGELIVNFNELKKDAKGRLPARLEPRTAHGGAEETSA
jgi:hypothetical protein